MVAIRRAIVTHPEPHVAVLIVDDNSGKRLALKAALEPLRYSIVEADSGLAALRCVMKQEFAVILLDVRMPVMDGFETARLIRERRQSELTPIIFITAHSSDEMEKSSRYANGAVDFIFAPAAPEELRGKVSAFANLYIRAANLAAQAQEVQTSADQLMLLTDAAPIGIFQTDGLGRFVYTNPRWSELTGLVDRDVSGSDWDSLVASEGWNEILDSGSEETPTSAEVRRFEIRLRGVPPRVVLMTKEAIPGNQGGVSGWVGTLADVSAEAGAEEERARFRSLVQNSRDVIAVVDASGRCSYVSPAVVGVGGFSQEEVMGQSGFEFIHPDDKDLIASHLSEIVAAPDEAKTVEVRTRTKAGEWIWIEIRAANRLDDPSIGGIVLNYHDITERREAADHLARSEASLAEGQSISHVGSFTVDLVSSIVEWSDELYRLLGLEPQSMEASFDNLVERIHPDDREKFSRCTQAAIAAGRADERDFRVLNVDGTIRWLHGKVEIVLEDGMPTRLLGMAHDITAEKEGENERLILLAQQKHLATQLRLLLDSTGEGIFGLDQTGACTFMNKAGAALLGGVAADFVGQSMHELTHHSYPDGSAYPVKDCPVHKGLSTGELTSASREIVWQLDGTAIPVAFTSYPIGGAGSTNGAVVTFQDVTGRDRAAAEKEGLEGQLRQAQKMEAVGQLAGGVAHDFNNILAVVLNYAEFVSETLEEGHEGHADLEQIIQAGQRGAGLVHQLLAFSRQEIIEPRVIDLNEVIDGMSILLDRSVGEEVVLTIAAADDLGLAMADQGQLEQILLNLVVNARDAMADGGVITVSTTNEELEAGERPGLEPGRYVCLTVADTGSGIGPEELEHIFEPFFTTKPRGEGTGLGLSTVYGIIKRAGGGIYADSAPTGATFSVFLPVTEEEVFVKAERPAASLDSGGSATILVVEDEDAVRELIGRILRREGYIVIDADGGAAAVEICRSSPDRIDLLLTDVVMPEMSGPALRDWVKPLRPDLNVLFMSGYTDELIAKRGVLGPDEALLNKPFNSIQLLSGVRSALYPSTAQVDVLEGSR